MAIMKQHKPKSESEQFLKKNPSGLLQFFFLRFHPHPTHSSWIEIKIFKILWMAPRHRQKLLPGMSELCFFTHHLSSELLTWRPFQIELGHWTPNLQWGSTSIWNLWDCFAELTVYLSVGPSEIKTKSSCPACLVCHIRYVPLLCCLFGS